MTDLSISQKPTDDNCLVNNLYFSKPDYTAASTLHNLPILVLTVTKVAKNVRKLSNILIFCSGCKTGF